MAKRSDYDMVTASTEQSTVEKHNASENVGKLAKVDDPRQRAIKNLLRTASVSVDDKLATVKAAHHVDKDRFQSAFRSLMGAPKS